MANRPRPPVFAALLMIYVLAAPQTSWGFFPGDIIDFASPGQKLSKFHAGLIERYPAVEHITTKELAVLPRERVVLIDVRAADEFNVSHLKNAIRVAPSTSADHFITQYAEQLAGKKVVFYCSVGERSSRLAEAVINAQSEFDLDVRNLAGGIFKWHNEQRQLVNARGATPNIHPFNSFWGRLLIHKDNISMK